MMAEKEQTKMMNNMKNRLNADELEMVAGGTGSLGIPRGGKINIIGEAVGIPRGGRVAVIEEPVGIPRGGKITVR